MIIFSVVIIDNNIIQINKIFLKNNPINSMNEPVNPKNANRQFKRKKIIINTWKHSI